MMLLVLYIILISVAAAFSVFTGYIVEHWLGAPVSMIYFLTLNTLSLWLSWVLAIKLTVPKIQPGASYGG